MSAANRPSGGEPGGTASAANRPSGGEPGGTASAANRPSGGQRAGTASDEPAGRARGRRFWLSALGGWAVMAVGLRGVLVDAPATRPGDLARFVLGAALVHDIVAVPLVIGAGALVARAPLGRLRPLVQAGLVVGAVTALFAFPLVRGYGRATGNPTSLPHDYARNLAVVLAVVWGGLVLLGVARRRRRHGDGPAPAACSAPPRRPHLFRER